jgi:UDP-hydrolysing UDP-N-acetyl-D-glucosamine 2-epimerase
MHRKPKKILYITGTRADFGLMTPILKAVEGSKKLDLCLYATGMHLMPEFGNTIALVRKEFKQAKKIDAIFNDSQTGILDFLGSFFGKASAVLIKERPDFVLMLGDRPEMLAVASACVYAGIPSGHLHGGEKTSTNDEIVRHAITKLSHLHFTATIDAAERIEKMGEEKWRTHVVGAPALDIIFKEKLPTRAELFRHLGIDLAAKIILVIQHPVSEFWRQSAKQMAETIKAVRSFRMPAVVIYPNADPGAREMIKVIEKEKGNPLFRIIPSLPYKQFLALEREAAVWVGNSSAAMIESASFKTPVVNIGSRQQGRLHGDNVIDVGYNYKQIQKAIIKSMCDKSYQSHLKNVANPWGDGRASERVIKILETLTINSKLLNKRITY